MTNSGLHGRFILNITARFIGRFVTGVPRERSVPHPLVSLYGEKGRDRLRAANARCNPYNVTPKRARNSNIMDSAFLSFSLSPSISVSLFSPHRVIHARSVYIALYCRFQPSLLIRHDGERAGKTYHALAPSCSRSRGFPCISNRENIYSKESLQLCKLRV